MIYFLRNSPVPLLRFHAPHTILCPFSTLCSSSTLCTSSALCALSTPEHLFHPVHFLDPVRLVLDLLPLSLSLVLSSPGAVASCVPFSAALFLPVLNARAFSPWVASTYSNLDGSRQLDSSNSTSLTINEFFFERVLEYSPRKLGGGGRDSLEGCPCIKKGVSV